MIDVSTVSIGVADPMHAELLIPFLLSIWHSLPSRPLPPTGKPLLARHRMVNAALKEELVDDIHALSMATKTPAQWDAEGGKKIEPSPPCAGGSSSR